MKTSLGILFLFFSITVAYSQDKLEREYRIKQSEVPATALEFIESTFENIQVKWYGEDNLNGKAIEAKGRYESKLYSIKFTTEGALQDVEVVIDFNTIPENVKTVIEKNLESRFSKIRIQKTQMQWLGSTADLKALIKGQKVTGTYSTNYEITLKGTKDRRTEYYEILSDYKGELIRESKILLRNNHHLIY